MIRHIVKHNSYSITPDRGHTWTTYCSRVNGEDAFFLWAYLNPNKYGYKERIKGYSWCKNCLKSNQLKMDTLAISLED